MRIWYDTEFIDNGNTIEFISIGMVREDGKTYYAINEDMNFSAIQRNPWLMKNVMTSLPVQTGKDIPWNINHPDFQHVKYRKQIADEVRNFCTVWGEPELWAWYAAYDHVVLSQLFGRMLDLPEDMPMYTLDLKQEHHRLGFPRLPEQMEGEHNALADAHHNRVIWEALKKYEMANLK